MLTPTPIPQETAVASETSRLRTRRIGDVVQVEFIDRNILDEANIQIIGEEISSLIDAQPQPKLLISFANVDHLSSAALGTLITINTRIRNAGGQLRLADIDPQIFEVFVITKLNKLFEIHETSADALKSFS
jgi:anti-sigma B factor antagonist